MKKEKIDLLYESILSKLKDNKRPQLNPIDLQGLQIMKEAQDSLVKQDFYKVKKIICILNYHPQPGPEFWPFIYHLLTREQDPQSLIDGLILSHDHIIGYSQKEGLSIPSDFDNHLRSLFSDQRSDIFFWAMQTLDLYGPMNLKFKKDLLNFSPRINFSFFDKNAKKGKKILNLYQIKWSEFEKRAARTSG